MDRPWLLDLFCGAGGAGEGYRRAGFHVVGVDIDPKPLRHNPHEWYVGDALDVLDTLLAGRAWQGYRLHDFDTIHASPPCQGYSRISKNLGYAGRHRDVIPPIRARLERMGLPWVIENVPGAPLRAWVVLCGSAFNLGIREQQWYLQRHRLFESSVWLWSTPCHHKGLAISVCGSGTPKPILDKVGRPIRLAEYKRLMGIDWMTREELSQAIPPAYTHWIGRQLLAALSAEREATA